MLNSHGAIQMASNGNETIGDAVRKYLMANNMESTENYLSMLYTATGIAGPRELSRITGLNEKCIRNWGRHKYIPRKYLLTVLYSNYQYATSRAGVREDGLPITTAVDMKRREVIKSMYDQISPSERVAKLQNLTQQDYDNGLLFDLAYLYPECKKIFEEKTTA